MISSGGERFPPTADALPYVTDKGALLGVARAWHRSTVSMALR